VPRQNAVASELRAIFHQFEQRVFAVRADDRDVCKVNNQLATSELFSSASPGTFYFRCPGRNQLALQNEPALAMSLNNRNLEHCCASYA
jgi:hypothetical protein